MEFRGFTLMGDLLEAISGDIRLDEIEAQFVADESAGKETLRKLQSERVGALVKAPGNSSTGAGRTVDIQAARERILDAQSAIEACHATRAEIRQRILLGMEADAKARAKEAAAEGLRLRNTLVELKRDYLLAMVAAAIAQMKYKGFWELMKRNGPGIGRLDAEDRTFFESEIDKLCAESGLNAEYVPCADRIKLSESRIEALRKPISMNDVQSAIEAVRQARAEG